MSSDSGEGEAGASVFRRGYLPVIAGSAVTSVSALFVLGAEMDSSAIAFYRLLAAAAVLFPLAALRRAPILPRKMPLFFIAVAGAAYATDMVSWHKCILFVGPGIATILTNFQIIPLAVIGVLFLREKMGWPQLLSVPLALAGLALLLGLHESTLGDNALRGLALGFVSALFYAFYTLSVRKSLTLGDSCLPVANVAWVSLVTAAFVLAYCLASGSSLAIPTWQAGATAAGLGIVCQAIGWVLLSRGLPHLTAFRAGLIMLLQPALGFIWDMLLYGTATSFLNIIGAVVAIGAIGLGMYSPKRRG